MSSDLSAEITAIATAALALLAIVTGVFALVTYALSGSRVRVDTRFGIDPSHLTPGIVDSSKPTFLPYEIVLEALHQGNADILLFAVIQNTGRLAVTVQECLWYASGERPLGFGTIGNPLGTPLPHRLEPGAQGYGVINLSTAIFVIDAPLAHSTTGRQAWPVVQLGNGRKRKGKAIEIPAPSETTTPLLAAGPPPASSQQSPDEPPNHGESNSQP
jgi:hypothetical protein